MNYDVIVVGSGNSGLVSALSLLKAGNKVLLLESNNNIGGINKGIVKGRFEFETSIHNLYFKNGVSVKNRINDVLKKCGVTDEVKFSSLSEVCRVITEDKDIVIPFGVENYINLIKEFVPESEESVRTFFELAKECREALDYVVHNKDYLDYDLIKEYYNNFMRISSYSVSNVLDAIEMPLPAQELINSLWLYYCSTETEISFVEYSVFLLNVLENELQVPTEGSYAISMMMASNFLEYGGEIKLNSKVTNLIIDDGKINGVRLSDGSSFFADKVVVNSSLSNVYGKLVKPEDAPREALKNVNSRELGARLFTVHLGLNRSAQELGLNNYTYLLLNSLDSDAEYARMHQINSGNQIAIVHNNAVRNKSPEGTCELSLNTMFFDGCFGEHVTEDNYYKACEDIADQLIKVFEKRTKVRIRDYIEEIEIVSPLDDVLTSDVPDGSTYGYKLKGLDNLLPRILNKSNERYIEGLYVCGGFDGDVYGYNSSLVSGLEASNELKKASVGDK